MKTQEHLTRWEPRISSHLSLHLLSHPPETSPIILSTLILKLGKKATVMIICPPNTAPANLQKLYILDELHITLTCMWWESMLACKVYTGGLSQLVSKIPNIQCLTLDIPPRVWVTFLTPSSIKSEEVSTDLFSQPSQLTNSKQI
jgi:hypothetical protein